MKRSLLDPRASQSPDALDVSRDRSEDFTTRDIATADDAEIAAAGDSFCPRLGLMGEPVSPHTGHARSSRARTLTLGQVRIASVLVGAAFSQAVCLGDVPRPIDGSPGPASSDADRPGSQTCNPHGEPTWQDPIDAIMEARCNGCHAETHSYSEIMPWVNGGFMERSIRADHFISGTEKDEVLRWIDIGAYETDCDIP